jgi:hypothetical protein
MLNRVSVWFLVVITLGFSVGIAYAFFQKAKIAEPAGNTVTNSTTKVPKPAKENNEEDVLPSRILLKVPFYPQAPFANWDDIHNEACEEASLLMVRDYYRNQSLDLEELDQDILDFIRYQTDHGYKYDVTVRELADLAKSYYRFTGARLIDNPTVDDIKAELAANRPVILPASGRMLENPNFRAPGPRYHMLVIKGYDSRGFITNDPGTRNGNSFRYSYDNLISSLRDWNAVDIDRGARRVLVFDR